MDGAQAVVKESLAGCEQIVLTGSGSSQYASECVAPALEADLGIPVEARAAGDILLYRSSSARAGRRTLVVSLARSGNSPESAAAVQILLESEPQTNHLILTCNAEGRLAREFAPEPRVQVVSLGEEVHDRSLVMTSSFTNLALSARFLGWLDRVPQFIGLAGRLDFAGRRLLSEWPDRLEDFVSGNVERIVFLGTGCRFAAAREAALKLLEMTGGKIATMAETFLGLRHGPMCFIDERTLVVCFVSSHPAIRAYERDLIRELNDKGLGARKLIAGVDNPAHELWSERDIAISYDFPGGAAQDFDLVVLDAMVGQVLGFHRCRQEGLRPDSPSESGVISRVVAEFQLYLPEKLLK
jgi:tagatose-6-phosphate ketose/aldose isomerase